MHTTAITTMTTAALAPIKTTVGSAGGGAVEGPVVEVGEVPVEVVHVE